ncbi:MAG: LapA family protein [Phycisphaerales bacterium]|nr:LapA family protein [Phycisphaerales bacterium]
MIEFPAGILIVISLAIGASVVSMLHVFSCVMKHEVTLHDLRNRVEKLHNDYALHLARMSGEVPHESDVEIIDDETGEPVEPVGTLPEPDLQATQAA